VSEYKAIIKRMSALNSRQSFIGGASAGSPPPRLSIDDSSQQRLNYLNDKIDENPTKTSPQIKVEESIIKTQEEDFTPDV